MCDLIEALQLCFYNYACNKIRGKVILFYFTGFYTSHTYPVIIIVTLYVFYTTVRHIFYNCRGWIFYIKANNLIKIAKLKNIFRLERQERHFSEVNGKEIFLKLIEIEHAFINLAFMFKKSF